MKYLLAFGTLAVALTVVAAAAASRERASGTLQLNALFSPTWQFGDYCPPGSPRTLECVRFLGEADVPGLGHATSVYTKTLGEDNGCDVTQFRTAVLRVAGKGEIDLSLDRLVCGPPAPAEVPPIEVRITGGSGRYAGASGTIVFKSSVHAGDFSCRCGRSTDTWTGTLDVPGLEFDLTAPTLTGAASKTVRVPKKAKRVRVRYSVAAQDAVDGAVPVACEPRSGSFFKLGRTRVACSATDSSGNTSRAQFTITVRRRA